MRRQGQTALVLKKTLFFISSLSLKVSSMCLQVSTSGRQDTQSQGGQAGLPGGNCHWGSLWPMTQLSKASCNPVNCPLLPSSIAISGHSTDLMQRCARKSQPVWGFLILDKQHISALLVFCRVKLHVVNLLKQMNPLYRDHCSCMCQTRAVKHFSCRQSFQQTQKCLNLGFCSRWKVFSICNHRCFEPQTNALVQLRLLCTSQKTLSIS